MKTLITVETMLNLSASKAICASLPLFIGVMVFSPSADALKVEDVPNPRQINGGWLTDMADILDETTETQLNRMITQLEEKNGSEMAVVTVSTTKPAPDFLRLF